MSGDRGVDVDVARLAAAACGADGEQMLDQLGAALRGIVDQARRPLQLAAIFGLATSVSVLPEITVSMLLKSFATPLVSLPMASSFCDCCNLPLGLAQVVAS